MRQDVKGVSSLNVAQPKREIHEVHDTNLMEFVVRRDNMKKAYRRVKQNKGAAGIDGVTTENFLRYATIHWTSVKIKLLDGSYKPSPVRRVEIPKPDGGIRELGIPTVMDRMIQQAILQILTPIFDPQFSKHSYGFRPGRNAHQAVKRARDYIEQKYNYVVETDLEKFFDTVNHDILMSKLEKAIKDKRILKLIRNYLKAGIMIDGISVVSEEGTPQGGPLSPLLANIMLHEVDMELEKRGHRFVRYADDINIYVKSKRAGERVLQGIKKFVNERLKLKVNDAKSAVGRPWKRKILGFSFFHREESIGIRIAPKIFERFKNKIRELTKRSSSQLMSKRIEKLNSYIRGWIGYFHITESRSKFEELDGWIRRKLRTCLLKQWKKPRTRYKNLVALGISEESAAKFSGSSKGLWHLSITPQMHRALSNAYWNNENLVSLEKRYYELRASAPL